MERGPHLWTTVVDLPLVHAAICGREPLRAASWSAGARTNKKKHLRREEARLGHGHVPRADDERWGVACVHGPLDDADLEAVAGGVDACDGGRGTAAVARTGVVGGVGGVDGHRAAVPGEDKVGAAGVFFRQDEFGRHYRDAKGRRRFAMSMASYGAGGGSGGREDARLIMSAMDSR